MGRQCFQGSLPTQHITAELTSEKKSRELAYHQVVHLQPAYHTKLFHYMAEAAHGSGKQILIQQKVKAQYILLHQCNISLKLSMQLLMMILLPRSHTWNQ